ncbi:MAG: hypothetical protein AAGC81_01885 [Pseudomonadota bacterium]
MAIATLAQVKQLIGIGDSSSDSRIDALLDPVTAKLEQEARRSFSVVTEIETHYGGVESLPLMIRPVVSVTTVEDIVSSSTVDPSGYLLDGEAGLLHRLPLGRAWDYRAAPFEPRSTSIRRWKVTYQAGYATVPADVEIAFADMINHFLTVSAGMQSEKDGDYSYVKAAGVEGLPERVRSIIAKYGASPI